MSEWQTKQFIPVAEFNTMSDADKKLIEFDPNKWMYEWETGRYYNAHHPGNDEWLLIRQAMEAKGYAA